MKKNNNRLGLLGTLIYIIILPITLLTNKKTRIPTLIGLILLIVMFPMIKSGIKNAALESGLDLIPYRSSEGSYDKVEGKLMKYLDEEEYKEAQKLMEANSWYTVKDAKTAQKVLDTIDESKYGPANWVPVIERLDGSNDKIRTQKDAIFHQIGMGRLRSNRSIDNAGEVWSKCSEGSLGYDSYTGFTKVFNHEALEGGKILYNRSSKSEKVKEDYETAYYHYMGKVEYQDVQDYMDHMLCMGCLSGVGPVKSVNQIKLPELHHQPHKFLHQKPVTSDLSMYRFIFMDEQMRADLTAALKNSSGTKVLVLDRVAIAGKDKIELGINGGITRCLPEEYSAESLEEVGYVLLMDYGYLKDSQWYAGTVTVRLFDVKAGKEIFTSQTLEGEFAQSYVGEPTNVIFGTYPDATDIVKEALSGIR